MKVRGGMWCERCGVPIAAVKNASLARAATTLATNGWSWLFSNNSWVCPQCGGGVVRYRGQQTLDPEARHRRELARAAPRNQAFCLTCWEPIYAVEKACPRGHHLRTGWDVEFTRSTGMRPMTRKAAFGDQDVRPAAPSPAPTLPPHLGPAVDPGVCGICGESIYAGETRCRSGHNLGSHWEHEFARRTGALPIARPHR